MSKLSPPGNRQGFSHQKPHFPNENLDHDLLLLAADRKEDTAYTFGRLPLHYKPLVGKLLLTGGDLEISTLQPGEGLGSSLTWAVPEEQPLTLRAEIATLTGFVL